MHQHYTNTHRNNNQRNNNQRNRNEQSYRVRTFRNITNVTSNNVLCVSFYGRLGNLMFQYASAFGIAKQTNRTFLVSEHDVIPQVFNTSAQTVPDKQYCKLAYNKLEKYHCAFDPNVANFSKLYPKVKLYQYLQSWKYFASVTNEVRKEFKFNEDITKQAEGVFNDAAKTTRFYRNHSTYIGLHIRRGDMFLAQIKSRKQAPGYNLAPMGYIEKAMSYFRSHYERVTFVICSDDIRWAVWQLGRYQQILNLVFIHKEPEIDLAVLGLCNHTIMTTGTFGWWGAWLAGGTTVYYKHYVKEDSAIRKQFSADFSDYFYHGWIPME